MFLNIQIDLLILKTYYGQFTLTTKKSLHIIFDEIMQTQPCKYCKVMFKIFKIVEDTFISMY